MSKNKSLRVVLIGFSLFCVAIQAYSQQNNLQKLTKELTILNSKEDLLTYKIGSSTIASGKLLNGFKTDQWEFFYTDGALRIKADFKNDKLHGNYLAYYQNGQELCSTHFTEGQPTKNWNSYYENGNIQGEITWLDSNLPKSVILYYKNGITAFNKTFEYTNDLISINITSRYQNNVDFESYTLEFTHHDFRDQLFEILLNTDPHLLFGDKGTITGFYNRKYNSGKTWIRAEFYNGKLLEVLEQNTPKGSPIESWKSEGTGKLIHFHHYSDTGAIVSYKNGLRHGTLKFFHSNNNTYKSGEYNSGEPSGNWKLFSQSGKTRQELAFKKESTEWTFYGPKNKREALYNLKNGILDGSAYRFNFFGDTSAVFHYQNGLLNGKFTKFITNTPLRSGEYIQSEQIGDWITHGQFNPVSHTTSFGTKQVIINQEAIVQPTFSYAPKIDIPLRYNFKTEDPQTLNLDMFLYSRFKFPWLLLRTPDSDEIWGSTWLKGTITAFGFIEELTYLKSPSAETITQSCDLISSSDLFIPATLCGFPIPKKTYMVLEHFRE